MVETRKITANTGKGFKGFFGDVGYYGGKAVKYIAEKERIAAKQRAEARKRAGKRKPTQNKIKSNNVISYDDIMNFR